MTQYIELMPSPASLIESLRSIGYSLEAAVADVIDNSIAAKAKHIDIRFTWNSGFPWLAVIDDGHGMTYEELVNAMRLGSVSPLAARDKDDLGRFGLGLKTASFSQCRQLTVLSKQQNMIHCCQWDIDLLTDLENSGWKLRILDADEYQQHTILCNMIECYLANKESGTVVLWEKLDRLKEPQSSQQNELFFDGLMSDVRKHLELVFHRFLAPAQRNRKLIIRMNNDELEPFNPFNPQDMATTELLEQTITVHGEKILVQPYILPHHSKVPPQVYKRYGGEEGYLHNQGFYIYRNQRLIIKGSWFRLIKKEELNKLIRVRVDIPNTLDHLWKLDVKKSFASPPEAVRQALQQVINKIEGAGRKVYAQRGAKLASAIPYPMWHRVAVNGTITYEINREHPMIAGVLESSAFESKDQIRQLIKMIETSFPADTFFNDFAQNPGSVSTSAWDKQEFEQLVDLFANTYFESGIPMENIAEKLLAIDPFASNRSRTIEILSQKGYML
jgi:hypothetical protein